MDRSKYNIEMVSLLAGCIFFSGLVWREVFLTPASDTLLVLGLAALASVISTVAVLCVVEIADRFMFGAGEDR